MNREKLLVTLARQVGSGWGRPAIGPRLLFSTRSRLLRSRAALPFESAYGIPMPQQWQSQFDTKYFGFFKIDWVKTISHEQYTCGE